MRVVAAIHSHFVELVYRVAARFAEEELTDGSGYDRMYGRPSRLENIDRIMRVSVVNLLEHIPQLRKGESADRRTHIEKGRCGANSKKH
jgi:hypothetical protein